MPCLLGVLSRPIRACWDPTVLWTAQDTHRSVWQDVQTMLRIDEVRVSTNWDENSIGKWSASFSDAQFRRNRFFSNQFWRWIMHMRHDAASIKTAAAAGVTTNSSNGWGIGGKRASLASAWRGRLCCVQSGALRCYRARKSKTAGRRCPRNFASNTRWVASHVSSRQWDNRQSSFWYWL